MAIGRFSKITRLTAKALRHYDELGLLAPCFVDPESGYRYYSPAQTMEAETIRVLRSVDMPLEEIAAVLAEEDPTVRRTRLIEHRRRLESKLIDCQQALADVEELASGEIKLTIESVKTKKLAAQPILSTRFTSSLPRLQTDMGKAFGRLFSRLGQAWTRPAGPPRETYPVSPDKVADPAMLRTEVAWPIGPEETRGAFDGEAGLQ